MARPFGSILLICFFSGVSSLIYEIIWLKELAILFGNTAQASAVTFSVFFLGLALGNFLLGQWVQKAENPLRVYAAIEISIACSAIWYVLVFKAYDLFTVSYSVQPGFISLGVKFLYSFLLLLPTATLIGGTFPVMGALLSLLDRNLSGKLSIVYALNTLGAASGAFLAGFLLPPWIGFKAAYACAGIINLAVSAASFKLSQTVRMGSLIGQKKSDKHVSRSLHMDVLGISFISGFLAIAYEVVCTRLFFQVTINCVYSGTVVLVSFILSFALGGFVASWFYRSKLSTQSYLYRCFLFSGGCIALSPLVFYYLSGHLGALYAGKSFGDYIFTVFFIAIWIAILPGTVLGAIFPYLFKQIETTSMPLGAALGRLALANTLGAASGALVSGFLLIPLLGAWMACTAIALGYFALSEVYSKTSTFNRRLLRFACFSGFMGLLISLIASLPKIQLRNMPDATLEKIWESPYGTVAVIEAHPFVSENERGNDRYIQLNNFYTLGGIGGLLDQQRQGALPLVLFPHANSVFIIGLATGITAGATLHFPVTKVVVSELIPEVTKAAQKYFNDYTNGLFRDPRVEIQIEDGRAVLKNSRKTYDLVIADLFFPAAAGTGILYSKEHFQLVKSKLSTAGVFVQWLPLYQLTWDEFGMICKTFLEVFPQSTLWRGSFRGDKPIAALIGELKKSTLDISLVHKQLLKFINREHNREVAIQVFLDLHLPGYIKRGVANTHYLNGKLPELVGGLPLLFYAGNISENRKLFDGYEINTQDRPLFEYRAPRNIGHQVGNKNLYLGGAELSMRYDALFAELPPRRDPYLKNLSDKQFKFIEAGLSYYKHSVSLHQVWLTRDPDSLKEAKSHYREFQQKTEIILSP